MAVSLVRTKLDRNAHIRGLENLFTKCGERIEPSLSAKGLAICDKCLEVASKELRDEAT